MDLVFLPFRERSFIKQALLENDFLKNLDFSHLDTFIDTMYMKNYQTGEYIINEGDIGQYSGHQISPYFTEPRHTTQNLPHLTLQQTSTPYFTTPCHNTDKFTTFHHISPNFTIIHHTPSNSATLQYTQPVPTLSYQVPNNLLQTCLGMFQYVYVTSRS